MIIRVFHNNQQVRFQEQNMNANTADLLYCQERSSNMPDVPEDVQLEVKSILSKFKLNKDDYKVICEGLEKSMNEGLSKETHSKAAVKMYPSYVTNIPSGSEEGQYLALDLGGTNYRILLVTLSGKGIPPKKTETAFSIPNDIMTGTGDQLFGYIADSLKSFVHNHGIEDKELKLGFTFSFPCSLKALDHGILTQWTKGFNASGVEGKNVCEILQKAIDKRGVKARCVAVVNDTVGTLTACALSDPKCAIGLIVGTGTNAAYLEKIERVELYNGEKRPKSGEVIINMEWGAFGDDGSLEKYRTDYDRKLDSNSLHPGKQLFEKMISGMYIGELVRIVLVDLCQKKLILQGVVPESLSIPNNFHTKYISETERDPRGLYYTTQYMLTEDLKIPSVDPSDCQIIRYVCEVIGTRAGYMAGAGIACLLNRLDKKEVTVGIDGSLFKFHPKFPEKMINMIHVLKHPDIRFVLRLSEDGSGKGAAAIAAATD